MKRKTTPQGVVFRGRDGPASAYLLITESHVVRYVEMPKKKIKNPTTGHELKIRGTYAMLLFICLGFLVYLNGVFNLFVSDDTQQILNNPLIQSVGNIGTYFSGGTFYAGTGKLSGVYFKPVTTTVLSLIYTYFGPNHWAFHLFQIGLHILNACLLYLFLTRLFKKPIALAAAVIFLVHPVNSEAVLYVSAMQETIYFCFGITALLFLSDNRTQRYYYPAFPCLLLSLLAKETGALFLVTGLTYIWIFRKKQRLVFTGFSLLLLIVYLILRFRAIGIFIRPTVAPIDMLPFSERLFNIPSVIFFYLKSFWYPLNLTSSYQWAYTRIDLVHFGLPLMVDLVFMVVLVYGGKILYRESKKKYFRIYLFFGVWFVSGMLLISQIVPLDATAAERWFYFPIVGLLGMMGAVYEAYSGSLPGKKMLVPICVIIVLFSGRTFIRTFDWRDQYTLVVHDVAVSPGAFDLEDGVGVMYLYRGQLDQAKIHIEKSIGLFPNFESYNNLGIVDFKLGLYQEARDSYLKSIGLSESYQADENLSVINLVSGNLEENADFIPAALAKYPRSLKLRTILALTEYKLNNFDLAKTLITKCYAENQSPEMKYYYATIISGGPLDLKIGVSDSR